MYVTVCLAWRYIHVEEYNMKHYGFIVFCSICCLKCIICMLKYCSVTCLHVVLDS